MVNPSELSIIVPNAKQSTMGERAMSILPEVRGRVSCVLRPVMIGMLSLMLAACDTTAPAVVLRRAATTISVYARTP